MMVTYSMLLELPALRTLRAVTGQTGLDREIKAISILDAPDSYKWLKGGEFIMTNAYLVGSDPKLLELFLMNLFEVGVSGLGIKKGRFLKEIPEDVILLAKKHQFPIIEIPYHFSWPDVISVFYELYFSIKDNENTHITIESDHIKQVYTAGRIGSAQLMDKLTELFNVPAAVLFNNKEIHMTNGLPGASLIAGALESSTLFPENMSNEVLKADQYYITVCEVPFFREGQAEYLAVMSQNDSFSSEIRKMFQLLADLGERENAIAADKAQIYRKFMLGFISGKITSEEIQKFKGSRNEEDTVYTGVLLIHSKDTMAVYYTMAETLKKARLMKKGKASSYIVENAAKQEAVVMLELRAKGDDETAKEWQRMFFEDMEHDMEGLQKGTISMGRLSPELDDIFSCYWEAQEAHAIGQILLEGRSCFSYQMLSPYSALRNANPAQIDLSYVEILGEDQKGLSFDGISTLEAYIECDGYKKAADKLYIHENTLRYRIQKISDFLHLDLNNPIVTHALISQIKLWKMMKSRKEP